VFALVDLILIGDLARYKTLVSRRNSRFLLNGSPPRSRSFLVDQRLVVQPRTSSSLTVSMSDWRSRYSSKIARTRTASSSLIHQLGRSGRADHVIAEDGHAAGPLALARVAAILSRVRSEMISRSNWANESRMFRISRPIGVAVLKCWVTETNDTWCRSNTSIIRAKSRSDRLMRSTL
jgi:hypothetical protein